MPAPVKVKRKQLLTRKKQLRRNLLSNLQNCTSLQDATGKLVEGDICAQAEQCCKNVVALLESQGLTTANVVKTTVFIADMNDFPKVNEVYKKYFCEPFPARSCVAIKSLPLGAQVEVEAIAAL